MAVSVGVVDNVNAIAGAAAFCVVHPLYGTISPYFRNCWTRFISIDLSTGARFRFHLVVGFSSLLSVCVWCANHYFVAAGIVYRALVRSGAGEEHTTLERNGVEK